MEGSTDTRLLLERIAAIRQRLGHAQGMLLEAHSEAIDLAQAGPIEEKMAAAERVQSLLDGSLKQISAVGADGKSPAELTHRARRCVERGRHVVMRLRDLGDLTEGPLAACYRRCTAMTEAAVRLVQAFPEEASAQIRLCDGIDGLLDAAGERIGRLADAVGRQAIIDERLTELAHLLTTLAAGNDLASDGFVAIADSILADHGSHLTIAIVPAISSAADAESARAWQVHTVAAHALLTAQVAAIAGCGVPEFVEHPQIPVVAALLQDVGMLSVPAELLAFPGRFSAEQSRIVEGHAVAGAALVERHLSKLAWMALPIRQHHERPDGTGYPSGSRELTPLARLLSVCDVYAAMIAPRPHRAAIDPRTALTEVLLQANRGQLDRAAALALQRLTYFPVGTVVELTDGAVGVVAAIHAVLDDPHGPARPVVALLTDAAGEWLPSPRWTDLATGEGPEIRRALPATERHRKLAAHYPQYA